ncbi:MAG: CotH kinase family protein, partial [Verrucomicrobiota bacterium]
QRIFKTQFSLDIWDETNHKEARPVLGLPKEADWVFYSPFRYDRALFRNAFMYTLSNRIGWYAPRWRFCEVFLNTDGGPLNYKDDYFGVYMISEKIEQGPKRVDVQAMHASISEGPELTGGYIWKRDWAGPDEKGFMAGGLPFIMTHPDESEITKPQLNYLKNHLNAFAEVLNGPDFKGPDGYRRFIDMDSWIDHWWLNVLPMNCDAFGLSHYLHKDRNGRIRLGPIWDFDRSLGSRNPHDDDPEVWFGERSSDYFKVGWLERLFQDEDWEQGIIDRWYTLRQGAFSLEEMFTSIDRMAESLNEAQERHFAAWRTLRQPPGQYDLANKIL